MYNSESIQYVLLVITKAFNRGRGMLEVEEGSEEGFKAICGRTECHDGQD